MLHQVFCWTAHLFLKVYFKPYSQANPLYVSVRYAFPRDWNTREGGRGICDAGWRNFSFPSKCLNVQMSVVLHEGRLTMLYELREGVAGSSFGIEVAKMVGLPEEIVKVAKIRFG